MKREKNASAAGKGNASQLKTNSVSRGKVVRFVSKLNPVSRLQAAQSIQCKTCFQTFQQTAKLPE